MLPTPSARSGSPCRSRKWATDNDLHDCPWTKSPGSNFLRMPSRGGAQCEELLVRLRPVSGSGASTQAKILSRLSADSLDKILACVLAPLPETGRSRTSNSSHWAPPREGILRKFDPGDLVQGQSWRSLSVAHFLDLQGLPDRAEGVGSIDHVHHVLCLAEFMRLASA